MAGSRIKGVTVEIGGEAKTIVAEEELKIKIEFFELFFSSHGAAFEI